MKEDRDSMSAVNECIEVIISHKLVQLCNDCYQVLGWKIKSSTTGLTSTKLRLERNKKIKNRNELCKLQREYEDAIMELERLEKLKNYSAKKVTWIINFIGIIFLTGSLFTYIFDMLQISGILAVTGYVGLGASYFVYHKLIRKNKNEIKQRMNGCYDQIHHTCKKAELLLNEC